MNKSIIEPRSRNSHQAHMEVYIYRILTSFSLDFRYSVCLGVIDREKKSFWIFVQYRPNEISFNLVPHGQGVTITKPYTYIESNTEFCSGGKSRREAPGKSPP